MGLMTARELARAGARVTVLERGRAGQEASWAGGGIVSPLYPWRYSAPVTALASAAQQAYPRLARELFEETGIDPELERCGMLMLDADDSRDAQVWAAMHGHEVSNWDAEQLQAQMPGLSTQWRQGLWMPGIANIRNPRLLKALRAAMDIAGVTLHENTELTGWERDAQGNVQAALTADGRKFQAEHFVICSGAWTRLLHDFLGTDTVLPIRPVRGQMLLYRLEPGALPCIVMAGGRYVIPRRDGHVLCGSTIEETGFDKSTTASAHDSLRNSAEKLWPELARHEPVGHWAGLRPGAPNGIPFIGRVPACANLWVNAGQFRNGLVLAPASARLLADQLLGRSSTVDPRPYQLPAGP